MVDTNDVKGTFYSNKEKTLYYFSKDNKNYKCLNDFENRVLTELPENSISLINISKNGDDLIILDEATMKDIKKMIMLMCNNFNSY